MKQNPTTLIKCTFSNSVHKLVDRNFGIKNSEQWKVKHPKLTNEEKIALFDEICLLDKATTKSLSSYQYNKRQKNRVKKARIARGYIPKKKQSKLPVSA